MRLNAVIETGHLCPIVVPSPTRAAEIQLDGLLTNFEVEVGPTLFPPT